MRKPGNVWILFLSMVIAGGATPIFAGGGQEVETEVFLSKPPSYISPGNAATGKDSLTIDNIRLKIDKNGVIKGYTLNIYNKNGEVVFTKTESQLEGRGFFGDLLNIGDVPQVSIPDSINWPGTDSTGKVVPDGEYFYQLTVLDNWGKKASSPPLSVVVDTKPPAILSAVNNYRIFSPNGDGVRDSITFSHKTDTAFQWTEEILTASGSVVWSNVTTAEGDTAASDIVYSSDTIWDGKANKAVSGIGSGDTVPEGEYSYRLTGTDRANNTASKTLPFVVSFSASDIVTSVSGGNPVFNPAAGIAILVNVQDAKGLETWKLEIADNDGIVYRRISGVAPVPASIAYNGRGNAGRPESEGPILKDGAYRALFSAVYDSGALSNADPLEIVIDSTPPIAVLSLDTNPTETAADQSVVFGAGTKTSLKINLRYDASDPWALRLHRIAQAGTAAESIDLTVDVSFAEIVSLSRTAASEVTGDGQTVASYIWNGMLPASTEVQGSAASEIQAASGSAVLPDGVWEAVLEARDAAGNSGSSRAVRFTKDTRTRGQAVITLSDTRLSPGPDSDIASVKIGFSAPVTDGVQQFNARLIGEDGRPYYTLTAQRWVPELVWTGLRNNDADAPDGRYRVELSVEYSNGTVVEARSDEQIVLDRQRPTAQVTVAPMNFTPNGDGTTDTVAISQSSSEAAQWTGIITDSKGTEVKRMTWQGRVSPWIWDGLGPDGKTLPDDIYTYEVSAVNDVGNRGSTRVTGIRIDNLSESVGVRVGDPVISPNGDGYLDSATIQLSVARTEELRGWEVHITREDGAKSRSFQGGTALQRTIAWDGKTDGGVVEDGVYRVDFIVEYRNGTKTSRQAADPIVVVKTPPVGIVTVEPEIFSPDGDDYRDTVAIRMDARASDRPVDAWKVEILDPVGHEFRVWEGSGVPPGELVWDGKGATGELAQSASDYTVLFTVQDSLRNTHRSMATISVDILVFKEGDRLRIALPSIQFAGDSADLFANAQDVLVKNLDTLRRLARILNRYPEYKISVEGHATYVWARTPQEQTREQNQELLPLSRQRATEVTQALTILGVQGNRMDIVGYGGARPVVPHTDAGNRWKNRRVEFILERTSGG